MSKPLAPYTHRINEPDASSPTGRLLRECLKSGAYPTAHAAMFLADRMALHAKILPFVEANHEVVSSRSFLSTLVYQQEQWPGPEGLQWLFDLHRMLPCKADFIFVLDVDPDVGLERVGKRSKDLELYERLDIQSRNRRRYLALAKDERLSQFLTPKGKVIVIDAMGEPVAVHKKVLEAMGR